MKKSIFFVFAFLFVALACVTFSACGQTDTQTIEEDGVKDVVAISDSEQIARANDYNYNYDNWYDFGKNNDVGIPRYNTVGNIEIYTAEQLARFLFLCNDNWGLTDTDYKWRELNVYITAEIDMSRMNWIPMGTKSNPYTGHFYGQNHYISGLKIYSEVNNAAGFFGFTEGSSSYVDDLAVGVTVSIGSNSGDCYAGGLIGQSKFTYVRRCAVRGSVYVGGKGTIRAGGIIGQALTNDGSKISDSVNYASVNVSVGSTIQGGLIGYAKECTIERCLNLGSVTKYGSNFAGIAGKIESGSITGCSEYGNVTKDGFSMIHGYNTSNVSVKNCAYGNTTSGGRNWWLNKTSDTEYNNLIGWTGSCQDSGDFTAWSKSVSSIQVPKSILFSFNISFGWDSPNGSGYFSSTNNAMYAFYDGGQVYGTGGAQYKYEYVRGAVYSFAEVNIYTNSEMFSYNNYSIDNTESGMFYSETGYLKFKNKILMSSHTDKKITYHSSSKTLTINAKNCNGYTNGGSYVYQRNYYYHDSISVKIYASHPLGTNVVCYETPTIVSWNCANTKEYYTPTFSNGSGDSDYVKLTYFTGTTTIDMIANAIEYKINFVFVDRINGNSQPKEELTISYDNSSKDIGNFATGGYDFTFYIIDGNGTPQKTSDISYSSGKVMFTNLIGHLNKVEGYDLRENKDLITVYANYGYVGPAGAHDVYLNTESASQLFLPIYDTEIKNEILKTSYTCADGTIDSVGELREALNKLTLDVGYLVESKLLKSDVSSYKITVKDNFEESPFNGDTVYSMTFNVYSGFNFGDSSGNKFQLDDSDNVHCNSFTIYYSNGVMIHNEINLNFTSKTYSISFDENTEGVWYVGTTVQPTKLTGETTARFNHKITVSANVLPNHKFVAITCNDKIVTLKNTYTFVVDPQEHSQALESNFKLSFKALYIQENFVSAEAPAQTGKHYQITSAANLQWLAEQVYAGNTFEGCTFTQKNDIDFSEYTYLPIGDETHAFKGTYDGGNYSIKNIKFENENYNLYENGYVGIFGNVENATIKNLTVKDSTFVGYRYVGAIAGKATNSTFYNLNAYNCIVDIKEYQYYDIYGDEKYSDMIDYTDTVDTNISITQPIYTNERVGFAGVVGNAVGCTFTGVGYNTGEISNTGLLVGAFVGIASNSTNISQCYANCTVTNVSNFVGNNSGFTASDFYFNDVKVETNSENWMTLGNKRVLKFFYWVV